MCHLRPAQTRPVGNARVIPSRPLIRQLAIPHHHAFTRRRVAFAATSCDSNAEYRISLTVTTSVTRAVIVAPSRPGPGPQLPPAGRDLNVLRKPVARPDRQARHAAIRGGVLNQDVQPRVAGCVTEPDCSSAHIRRRRLLSQDQALSTRPISVGVAPTVTGKVSVGMMPSSR